MNASLYEHDLPQFSQLDWQHAESKLTQLLADNQQAIHRLLRESPSPTWSTFVEPLDELEDRLDQYWSLISHLHAVADSESIRKVYRACLPKLSEYGTSLSHNPALYQRMLAMVDQPLEDVQHKILDDEILGFKLSGIDLSKTDQRRFSDLVQELSKLSSKFEENILDASQAWTKHVTDLADLSGIPEHALTTAARAAAEKNLAGYVFTLELPDYIAVMRHADARSLREEMYIAFSTRASDQGPQAGKWDNTPVMHRMMVLRTELAHVLGFANYAEYALATRMVKTSDKVLEFLAQLSAVALPKAKKEYEELCSFARETLGLDELYAWDVTYASEKLRQRDYAISEEDLRPYFPEPRVLSGLFEIVHRLFGITIHPVDHADVWHPDVRCYAVYDADRQLRSYFYLDLYVRPNKRNGAWMDDCRSRRLLKDKVQCPIAFVNCNFNRPIDADPALFTHDDVVTLFHEFGHALQHMLTTVNYLGAAGLNGIPWDAVEFASQFLENWAWQRDAISKIAVHYQTGEPLPDTLFQRMRRAKKFQAGLHTIRQLEFALFDIRLHVEFSTDEGAAASAEVVNRSGDAADVAYRGSQMQQILDDVRQQVNLFPIPAYNRFAHSFSHIFAGGYAAGYYSYKWAEVMAADVFALFEERGIFDAKTAQSFLANILEPGGSQDPLVLFTACRGREPRVEALLKQLSDADPAVS